MKYAMLNSWTDRNKGDLGIMIATIQEIKKLDPEADFIAVSSYSSQDPCFLTEHERLKSYVTAVYPAVFGVLAARVGKIVFKNTFFKSIVGIWDFIRFFFCIVFPAGAFPLFLSKGEMETLRQLKKCHLLISKGGSIFVNDKTLRSKISFLRLCSFYRLLKKLHCPYVILGQSFGPVWGRICSHAFEKVVENSERLFVREHQCLRQYHNMNLKPGKVAFSNDIAFLLPEEQIGIRLSGNDIGMTIRTIADEYEDTKDYFIKIIEHLVEEYGFHVHLFLQVSDPYEPDTRFTKDVYNNLSSKTRKAVTFHEEEYTPQQLKYLYGKMRLFIGTRLHSTIFSLGAGVPTICHIYQGTKAQGIYQELGLEELIAASKDLQKIKCKIKDVTEHETAYREQIEERVENARCQARRAVAETVQIAGSIH